MVKIKQVMNPLLLSLSLAHTHTHTDTHTHWLVGGVTKVCSRIGYRGSWLVGGAWDISDTFRKSASRRAESFSPIILFSIDAGRRLKDTDSCVELSARDAIHFPEEFYDFANFFSSKRCHILCHAILFFHLYVHASIVWQWWDWLLPIPV